MSSRGRTVGLLVITAALLGLFPARVETQRFREQFNGHDVAPGEVLVRMRDLRQLPSLRRQLNATDEQLLGDGRWRRFRTHSSVQALVQILRARGDVDVEPNYIIRAVDIPNDPQWPSLWALSAASPGIHAASAWELTTGGTASVVGVVDTGIDYTHPDLAANVWSAPSGFTVTVGGSRITCPAGSHGFNALALSCDPADDQGHGTHVSGTIGAVGNNGTGVVGVNWKTRIMGLKILDSTGSGTTADAINAIDFAIQTKQYFAASAGANVRVLSNSYGGDASVSAFSDAIDRARSADILFVAAAGNGGTNDDSLPFYPASYTNPNVLSVAASDGNDGRAGFSNYGPTSVDLAAPGVSILSTAPGGSYAWMSGTSMATPHVAGAAALVLSACRLTTPQLASVLLSSVDPLTSFAGLTVSGGRLNVDRALRSCATLPAVALDSPAPSAVYTTPAEIPLAATASDPDGIARVDFYDGSSLITTVTAGPYVATWSNVSPGLHVVTAVATDTLGLSTSSSAAVVTVKSFPRQGPVAATKLSRAELGDMDGDRRTDIDVFRPATGTWYRLSSASNFSSGSDVNWGTAGDVPVSGDYDGDGKSDITVYRPSNGVWYVLSSSTQYTSSLAVRWGTVGDIPVPGDYDGDGKTDIAVFRPSTGTWYILLSSSGFTQSVAGEWGVAGDIPVPGDYDGDAVTDIAVFRPAEGVWYVLTSSSNFQSTVVERWGTSGDIPVPADYDGDGTTDFAVWRPGTGTWYVVNSSNGSVRTREWGAGFAPYDDLPVPGDYDGDGKADFAVWRRSTGVWYVMSSATGAIQTRQWGAGYAPYDDVPVNGSATIWLSAHVTD